MRARVCPGAAGPGEPRRWWRMVAVTSVVILGGGPGGYEAALVAAQLGAEVTLVDRDGIGGACVLTDCVPSKTLIATSDVMTSVAGAGGLGVTLYADDGRTHTATWGEADYSPPDVVDLDVHT